jgi:CheY-like chemotaxis protein
MQGQLTHRVLLVDDALSIRKVLSNILVGAGYVVRTAVDGLDGIGKLRQGAPDLIISDLMMPRMTGFEFLTVVRQRLPQIPVIAMSCDHGSLRIAEGALADLCFPKDDFRPEDLLEAVADLIGKPPARSPAPGLSGRLGRAKWDGDGHYDIPCSDCLRSFKILCSRTVGQGEQTATCVDCLGLVRFVVDAEGSSEKGSRNSTRPTSAAA